MEPTEALVVDYLSNFEKLFVASQFRIERAKRLWAVTTGGAPDGLIGRVRDRQRQWIDPLEAHLEGLGLDVRGWRFVVRAFIRQQRMADFTRKVADSGALVHVVVRGEQKTDCEKQLANLGRVEVKVLSDLSSREDGSDGPVAEVEVMAIEDIACYWNWPWPSGREPQEPPQPPADAASA